MKLIDHSLRLLTLYSVLVLSGTMSADGSLFALYIYQDLELSSTIRIPILVPGNGSNPQEGELHHIDIDARSLETLCDSPNLFSGTVDALSAWLRCNEYENTEHDGRPARRSGKGYCC